MTDDDPITSMTLKCKAARTDACRVFWARQVIDARRDMGQFDLVQGYDHVMREALVLAMIRQQENAK